MFSQQQPMRNMRQPGPPNRPAPNQRMMGGRPPAMRQPSFSGQQQGFQPPRQSFPQQPGIESRNGLGGGLKGMLSKFLPGAGGTGAPGAAAGGGSGLQGIQNLANPGVAVQHARQCPKSARHGSASHSHDSAVWPISAKPSGHDEAVQPIEQ